MFESIFPFRSFTILSKALEKKEKQAKCKCNFLLFATESLSMHFADKKIQIEVQTKKSQCNSKSNRFFEKCRVQLFAK